MRNALIVAALLAAPAAAMAEGISYNYVDARYFSTDSDALNINQHGGSLAASYAITPMFFASVDGSYGQSERLVSGTTTGRFNTFGGSARVGAHHALTPVLDIVADGGALYSEFKGKGAFSSSKDNDVGYIAELGLRVMVIPQFELGAFYNYQDVFNSDTSSFTADLQYHFAEHFSVVASATNARSTDVYSVGARYRF